jgi:threonine/homoserine/homoserine lactone efflux protein
MLCITRTLAEGRGAGLATGLGAALADALYGAIAGFGLTALATLLEEQGFWLRLLGGLILILMGIRTFLRPPEQKGIRSGLNGGLVFDFSSTFVLTLANPITILVSAAIFAGMGHAEVEATPPAVGLLVLGVFLGSLIWWLFLVLSAGYLRDWFNPAHMTWVTRIAGGVIAVFGAGVLVTAIL